jgi:DNA repair protein RecO (recombination protein O)
VTGPKQRPDLEPAFLMHRRPYRETSALLETFTREHGRVALVARGARRPRSALRGALQPFVPLLIGWSARGELGTLRSVDVPVTVSTLEGRALLSGLYVNELLMRLTHRNDPHPELFDAYVAVLASLREGDDVPQSLRLFEKRTLESIGYGMLLDREADSGAPVAAERRYAYRPDHGPTLAAARKGESVEVTGATLLALAREGLLDTEGQREAKRLMRFVIQTHLGGRPLASRTLFRSGER